MAQQCRQIKVAVDPFCGAGGNVIQLARLFDKGTVIFFALEINKTVFVKIKCENIIYSTLLCSTVPTLNFFLL